MFRFIFILLNLFAYLQSIAAVSAFSPYYFRFRAWLSCLNLFRIRFRAETDSYTSLQAHDVILTLYRRHFGVTTFVQRQINVGATTLHRR